jgi:hypothetical protein
MPRYRLRFRSPFCPNSSEIIDWKHIHCGEYEEIDEDGFVLCNGCQKINPLEDFCFKCGHCPNDYSYNRGPERAYEIFKILCSINEEIGDKEFMGKLIHNVFKRLGNKLNNK